MTHKSTVIIVQRRLTHYRVDFFERLRHELLSRNLHLRLLVGDESISEKDKCDSGEISWSEKMPTQYFIGERLCWQPVYRYLSRADLVIITQENSLLVNHLLLILPRNYKLAFWGHGANLQSNSPNGLKERFKRWTTKRVDWWFAYTSLSEELVVTAGFPSKHITILNNAVDTTGLLKHKDPITTEEMFALRSSLGFIDGPVGVFVGSLYAGKRLDFLFSAAEAIRQKIVDFQLLVIGEGPECEKVWTWCDSHPWARWVGAKFDREKFKYISLADIMMNPGAVGLGILDSFASGVPMLTTACGNHGPEIAYLENGRNGLMTANDLASYTNATVHLLRYPKALAELRSGCAVSANEYTLENMVHRFAEGIELALNNPAKGQE